MTIIATDLDRTLVFSTGYLRRHPSATPSCEVETYRGANISVAALEVRDTLRWLSTRATLVPTTTRTRDQLRRLRLGIRPRYEICCSGAVLLVDDVPDPKWQAQVRAQVSAECMTHGEATRAFTGWTGHGWLRELRDVDGVFLVASVDADLLPAEVLAEITDTCRVGNWRVVAQGSKVYALPRVITKSAAVRHLRDRLGSAVPAGDVRDGPAVAVPAGDVWAAGDSVLDWDLLAHAARAWTPAGSELAATGRTAGHLETTRAIGLDASVEIVRAWRALLGGDSEPADEPPVAAQRCSAHR